MARVVNRAKLSANAKARKRDANGRFMYEGGTKKKKSTKKKPSTPKATSEKPKATRAKKTTVKPDKKTVEANMLVIDEIIPQAPKGAKKRLAYKAAQKEKEKSSKKVDTPKGLGYLKKVPNIPQIPMALPTTEKTTYPLKDGVTPNRANKPSQAKPKEKRFKVEDGLGDLKREWVSGLRNLGKFEQVDALQSKIDKLDGFAKKARESGQSEIKAREKDGVVKVYKVEEYIPMLEKRKQGYLKEMESIKLPKKVDASKAKDSYSVITEMVESSEDYAVRRVKMGRQTGSVYSYSESDDGLEIQYLATNPKAILGSNRFKGAATEAVKDAIKVSKEKGYKGVVKLYALEGAVGFYEKLGFRKADGLYHYLSTEDAERLLSGK